MDYFFFVLIIHFVVSFSKVNIQCVLIVSFKRVECRVVVAEELLEQPECIPADASWTGHQLVTGMGR